MTKDGPSLKARLDMVMQGMGPFTPLPEAASDLSLICLDEIMSNLDGTIKGEDPEFLHDTRVASRRLRSALRVFGHCFSQRLAGAKDRARFVTSLLGFVRDLDVRIIHLNNIKGLVGRRAGRAADLLIFSTSMQWEQAREHMIVGLNLLKDGDWADWMAETLRTPSYPSGNPWYPSVHALPVVVTNRTAVITNSHLAKVEGALAAQHALRISVKKYRYALELLSYCFREDVTRIKSDCKTIQDDLGLMHDYDILGGHIKASRSRTLPKNIKKGLDDLMLTISTLRHEQFDLFREHIDPFIEKDPMRYRI